MTKKTENGVQDTPENSSLPVDSLAAAFAAGMKQALEQVAPKPAFDYAEYIQRPENIDPATTLKRPVLQHGHPINTATGVNQRSQRKIQKYDENQRNYARVHPFEEFQRDRVAA